MGTNYYVRIPGENPCAHCGRSDNDRELHIGKSSAGWCFSLHVMEDDEDGDLNSWGDWQRLLAAPGVQIRDEYNRRIDLEQLRAIVEDRSWCKMGDSPPDGYKSEAEFHRLNHSQPGPNNLLRYKVDGQHCVGHGEGTWDYIAGEFS